MPLPWLAASTDGAPVLLSQRRLAVISVPWTPRERPEVVVHRLQSEACSPRRRLGGSLFNALFGCRRPPDQRFLGWWKKRTDSFWFTSNCLLQLSVILQTVFICANTTITEEIMGSDNSFGPQHGTAFDFTLLFNDVVLTIIPATFLIAVCPVALYSKRNVEPQVDPSPAFWAKLVRLLLSLLLQSRSSTYQTRSLHLFYWLYNPSSWDFGVH